MCAQEQIRVNACFSIDDTDSSNSGEAGYLLGRHYTIYPVVMLREGVHAGTSGVADYFAANEIEQSARTWAGKPVTIGHPNDSCENPSVLEDVWVGSIFDARYDDEMKALKAKAWIDNERGDQVIDALKNGKKIDVSVGVWGNFNAEEGRWGEETYNAKAEGLVADHLAILPDTEGACSWDDGCGIREYGQLELKDLLKIEVITRGARTPSFNGTEETTGVDFSVEAFIKAYYKGDVPKEILSVGGTGKGAIRHLPVAAKRWIASKTLLGDERADTEGPLIRDAFPVVNPKTNKLNLGALRGALRVAEKREGTAAERGKKPVDYCRRSKGSLKSVVKKVRALIKKYFPKAFREEAKMDENKLARDLQLSGSAQDIARCVDEAETFKELDACVKGLEIEPSIRGDRSSLRSDIGSLLETASPELRKDLQESYALAQTLRQEATKRILEGPVVFCADWLGRQSLGTLQKLDELVAYGASDSTPDEEAAEPKLAPASYALQSSPASERRDKYVAPPVIKWS